MSSRTPSRIPGDGRPAARLATPRQRAIRVRNSRSLGGVLLFGVGVNVAFVRVYTDPSGTSLPRISGKWGIVCGAVRTDNVRNGQSGGSGIDCKRGIAAAEFPSIVSRADAKYAIRRTDCNTDTRAGSRVLSGWRSGRRSVNQGSPRWRAGHAGNAARQACGRYRAACPGPIG